MLLKKIIKADEVDRVAISSSVFLKSWAFTYAFQLTENKKYYDIQNEEKPSDFYIDDKDFLNIKSDQDCRKYVHIKIKKILCDVGIKSEVEYINHHLAHASSTYYSSGFKKALSITMDGEGDFTFCNCKYL